MLFFAAAGKYYLCNWLITFEPGGCFFSHLINWEKCAAEPIFVESRSSVSLAYIGSGAAEVSNPKNICQLLKLDSVAKTSSCSQQLQLHFLLFSKIRLFVFFGQAAGTPSVNHPGISIRQLPAALMTRLS